MTTPPTDDQLTAWRSDAMMSDLCSSEALVWLIDAFRAGQADLQASRSRRQWVIDRRSGDLRISEETIAKAYAERDEARAALETISSLVLPGTADSVDVVLKMMAERDAARVALDNLTKGEHLPNGSYQPSELEALQSDREERDYWEREACEERDYWEREACEARAALRKIGTTAPKL